LKKLKTKLITYTGPTPKKISTNKSLKNQVAPFTSI
ncbi:MAG: hypothetical protein ACI8P9_001107, partial [Parasphingorhabdus sp.]